MDLINHIDTIIVRVIEFAYNSFGQVGLQNLMPARLDQLIGQSGVASDTRAVLQNIALILCLIFAAILGITMTRKRALTQLQPTPTGELVTEPASSLPTTGILRERWNDIMTHLDSPRENDWKQAVVEADKLVDSFLQQAGFPGETFGDRLTNIEPGSLLSLDGLWWAHRIRNRVAHELDYFLRYTEARQAVSYFQAALEELKLV